MDVFYINFSITTPEFLTFLENSACLSPSFSLAINIGVLYCSGYTKIKFIESQNC